MRCGLLGQKLSHSYSPQIHSLLGSYDYALLEKEPEELAEFLKTGDFTGINVTIPYKKAVIPFMKELSPAARKMGAVNTILRRSDGSLYGHNTDCYGFSSMVQRSGLSVAGKKVLILGSGGASATAAAVLEELGAWTVTVSRTGKNNYHNLHLHADAAVIVNATPVGMFPGNGQSPVSLDNFPMLEGVLDLIYNPARTKLLMDARSRGLVAENGLWMLVAQAKEAAEYFTGTSISDSVIPAIHSKLSGQMRNIVLIGMPGCGKSTIGTLLAEKCGKVFVDADEEIRRLAGKSIPEIFAEEGEEAFRAWETRALEQQGKQSGIVLATGGGCVTRMRNLPLLRQNGTVFWLHRDPAVLPKDGRPLSQQQDLEEMYRIRRPLYEVFADHSIPNDGSPESAVNAILACLEETQ